MRVWVSPDAKLKHHNYSTGFLFENDFSMLYSKSNDTLFPPLFARLSLQTLNSST